MKSLIIKRSIVVNGYKTSVSLEDAFWNGLKEIAHSQHITVSNIIGKINASRLHGNLSSAIRLFVLDGIRTRAPEFIGDDAKPSMWDGGNAHSQR